MRRLIAAEAWIETLELVPLPEEGGLYRETYRAAESVAPNALPARFGSARTFGTAIYYLLKAGEFSAFHSVKQDEMWHFYYGAPLTVHVLGDSGYNQLSLGIDPAAGQRPQGVVPAGDVFAAEVADDGAYSLLGCPVSPGFEFRDFTLHPRDELLRRFPEHAHLVRQFTREVL